jgi:hypothetical protein
MFFQLLNFEFKYLSRQLSWWFAFIMLTVFGFLLSDRVIISGNVFILSPQNITYAMTIISQISIFTTTLITANSALRDTNYDFSSLVETKPVDKKVLLLSRFISLFVMSLVIVLGAIFAVLLPTLLKDTDPEVYGVFNLSYALWPVVVIILPNLLFTVSLLFFSAVKFKTTTMTFLSGIGIYIFYLLSAALLDSPIFTASDPIARGEINYASLLDPFAVSAFLEQTQFWTSDEKNTALVNLSGNFLYNRMIWLFVSFTLVASLLLKNIQGKGGDNKKTNKNKSIRTSISERKINVKYTPKKPKFNLWSAFICDVFLELRMTLRGLPFLLLLALVALLVVAQVINGMQNNYFVGVQYAYTSALLPYLAKPLGMVGLFIVLFFTGEMVWRAKDTNFDGVISVTPAPKWLYFISKISVMACLILLMLTLIIMIGIGFQLWRGFYANDLYLFLTLIPIYGLPLLLMSVLSLSIQYVSINKYVGFVVAAALLLVFKTDIATMLGLEHNMLRFTDTGPHYYSDFSGYDLYLKNTFWFSLYWMLVTSVIAIICYGIAKRSLDETIFSASKRLMFLLSKGGGKTLQLSSLLTLLCGSFIFYNTNILNHYVSADELAQTQLDYETQLHGYKHAPAPKITDVNLDVGFFPNQHKVVINGKYLLRNNSKGNIDKFIITLPNTEQKFQFTLNRDYHSQTNNELSVIEVELTNTLLPGEQIKLDFTTSLTKRGFKNADRDISLLTNGSYFHGSTLLPFIGYDAAHELQNNEDRLANNLLKKATLPKLIAGKTYDKHGHENDARWINFEAIVSTISDQIAMAPGVLQKQWTKNNRAYFHYKVNHKISNFLGFSSARYKTQNIRVGKTHIKAFFHPSHDKNIDLMLNTAAESLKYFEKEYGPYPFPELKLVELPNRAFARAYPATIYISEHVGLKENITQGNGPDDFSYLIAHEVAHQLWGHQLASAKVEGEVLLNETLADYSALMVMKKLYGETYVNNVVADSTQQYLGGRGSDVLGETPLYKMLGQRYLRYHKGPVVLNAIRHLITENKLNQALKLLLNKKSHATENYATSLDLLSLIKEIAGESHQEKIDEWLTEIVTYDLNMSNAKTEHLANGKYQVTASVSGTTFKHDPLIQQDFTHDVTVGIYSEVMGQPYLLQQQSIQMINGVKQITFILDDAPFKIVIDPHFIFIDRNRVNNESRLYD